MTENATKTINLYWDHLLNFNSSISIPSAQNFVFGLSERKGVITAEQISDSISYYLSSSNITSEGFEIEALFGGKLFFYYKATSPDFIIQFLRDYWTLMTFIKIKPADQVFVLVHMAQSLDGKVCTSSGNSKWIGNQENLIHAHRLRAIVDGVLVGGNTASADLPKLTVRHVKGNNPARIIYSDNFDGYPNLDTVGDQQTINIRSLPIQASSNGVVSDHIFYNKNEKHYLKSVLDGLHDRGIHSILVEGGPTMSSSFLAEDLVDVLQIHIAPIVIGSGKSAIQFQEIDEINDATQLEHSFYSKIGDAKMITGIPNISSSTSTQPLLKRRSSAPIPTKHGTFDTISYSYTVAEKMPHLVLLNKETNFAKPVNVRIHSECMTGDVFGSYRCECGEQLDKSMEYVAANGGMIIYLRQEGRGIGLINKLHAYTKQDEGYNTADANKVLGFGYDDRTYQDAVAILNNLGVTEINLLTNNGDKIKAIANSNIKVCNRLPLEIEPKEENIDYLRTKKDFFGHQLGQV